MEKNIEGVKITPLKIISDDRGSVMHMMRNDSDVFDKFGEIYFSTIFKGKIKSMAPTQRGYIELCLCIWGSKNLFYSMKEMGSSTFGEYQELLLSLKNYNLITIPPNIWNGFKGCNDQFSIIANCLNLPHNEKEMVRLDVKDNRFKYHW